MQYLVSLRHIFVPYAYMDMVKKEPDRLVPEVTLEPVQYVDWVSPFVPAHM